MGNIHPGSPSPFRGGPFGGSPYDRYGQEYQQPRPEGYPGYPPAGGGYPGPGYQSANSQTPGGVTPPIPPAPVEGCPYQNVSPPYVQAVQDNQQMTHSIPPSTQQQVFPQYGYRKQGYPHGYMPQEYPPQGFLQQGYPPQGYSPQGYPPQGYSPQGYPIQQQATSSLANTACCATCLACLTCLMCSCCQALLGVPADQDIGDDTTLPGTGPNVVPPTLPGTGPNVVPPPLDENPI